MPGKRLDPKLVEIADRFEEALDRIAAFVELPFYVKRSAAAAAARAAVQSMRENHDAG
jgi:hypothetical protein